MKRKLLGVISAAVLGITALPLTSQAAAGEKFSVGGGRNQYTGNSDGYSYEIWLDQTGGSGSMTLGSGATFDTEWSASVPSGNFLARRGKTYDRSKKATDCGTIVMDYAAQYSAQNGNSRLCVYGWFVDPLVEYYIIEDWKNWRPTGNSKTVKIDGADYEIFQISHTGPTILGDTRTFQQYFSVRKQTRNSGTITISDHFKAWAQNGMQIGNLTEVALNVEGWESSGRANVTKLTLSDTTPTPTPTTTKEPPKDGIYLKESFESGVGDFKGRASESVKATQSAAYSGNSSALISGRTNAWNGIAIDLDSSSFVPGETYSFAAAVAPASSGSMPFKMSLQYGSDSYDEIASATGEAGKWTAIGNTAYTIPSTATQMTLYIETEEGTGDFYVDDILAAVKGTASSVKSGDGTKNPDGSAITTGGGDNPGGGEDHPYIPSGDGSLASHQNRDYTFTQGGDGYKDHAGKLWRVGTSVSGYEIGDSNAQNFIKKNFNSITCENEMKPENICDQRNSSGDNIAINLGNASQILKFCEQNGIGLRGHTFVWYSQTPDWIFKENMSTGQGSTVSPDRMNKRLESMIKNTFDALKRDYPNLKVYAYDVCNELFINDGGGMRGQAGDFSKWWDCYKSDEFVINAFKYARQYAPAGCKLYLNDYNEYIPAKTKNLCDMAKKIMAEGDYIDGIGMQSHLDGGYPDKNTYETALKAFMDLGLDVQITELDITNKSGGNSAQTALWSDIYTLAAKYASNISAVTVWGTTDERSWRKENDPLMFTNYQPKQSYNNVIKILDNAEAPAAPTTTATTAATTTTTTTTTTTKATTKTTESTKKEIAAKQLGDVNNDGVVNISDVILLSRYVANDSVNVTDQGIANADCTKDKVLDLDDVTLILQSIARLITL